MAKNQFIDFINSAVVEREDVRTHTWMYPPGGSSTLQPKGGIFFIDKCELSTFYRCYAKAYSSIDMYLSETVVSNNTRVYFDVDGCEDINVIKDEIKSIMKEKYIFPCPDDRLIIKANQNTVNKTKYHLHAFIIDPETEVITPISTGVHDLKYITKKLKEKHQCIDVTKALRMIGSYKKEGKEKGRYIPEEGITRRSLENYSINSVDTDISIKPSHEFMMEMVEEIKKGMKKVKSEAFEENSSQAEINERLDYSLPILQENGYLDEYSTWLPIVWICRKYNYPIDKIEELCMASENYTPGCVVSKYESFDECNSKLSMGTIHYYLKNISEEVYNDYKKKFFKPKHGGYNLSKEAYQNIWNNEKGQAYVVKEYLGEDIVITNEKEGSGYLWSDSTLLWEPLSGERLISIISDILERIFSEIIIPPLEEEIKNIEVKIGEVEKDPIESMEVALEHKRKLAAKKKAIKYLESSRTYNYVRSVRAFLKSIIIPNPNFELKLNTAPFLFPIKGNKVVDLKTGEIKDRRKEDYFSFERPINMGNPDHPNVLRFFNDIMGEYQEGVEYLQIILGYMLSGSMRERSIYVFHGVGKNGKSCLLELLSLVLGVNEYYTQASQAVFVTSKKTQVGGVTPEILPLKGTRVAAVSEPQPGYYFNETLLKGVSGGDIITCNPKHKDVFSFKPTAKLILACNQVPEFNASDKAMIDRLRYIPFDTIFTNKPTKSHEKKEDFEFIELLKEEHIDDIFAYLIEGSKKYWGNESITIPEKFTKITDEMIEEKDDIQQFITECTQEKIGKYILVSSLYMRYTGWCKDSGFTCMGRRVFASAIESKCIKKKRISKGYVFMDITEKEMFEEETDGDSFESLLGKS